MYTFESSEYERLLTLATCRCNRHHILAGRDDEPGPRCVKCGRLRNAGQWLALRYRNAARAVVA